MPTQTVSSLSVLPDAEVQPTVDLITAARAWGIGRSAAYEGAKNGTLPFPVISVGRHLRVPTAPLRRGLQLDGPTADMPGATDLHEAS
jgi:hypothetical protein